VPPAATAQLGYETLGAGPLVTSADGRVQVTEFFMWGCLPCFAFETELVGWEATARERVELVRVPVLFNPVAELHARAFYTAAALGKLDGLHQLFYDEIHVRGNALDSPAAIAALFASVGVDARAFEEAFHSSDVTAAVERAAATSREYRITGTPTLVVGGRYATNPRFAGSPEGMLAVVDQLIGEACGSELRC
jgi:thiol:disulfide interchange protein DsbA